MVFCLSSISPIDYRGCIRTKLCATLKSGWAVGEESHMINKTHHMTLRFVVHCVALVSDRGDSRLEATA